MADRVHMAACTNCGKSSTNLTACEGARLCPNCTNAYLEEVTQNFNANYYGEPYRYARGADLPIIPRAGTHLRNRSAAPDTLPEE